MAEEKKVTAVQEKSEKKASDKKVAMSRAQKILNWSTKLPSRIAVPFKNMWYELKKVSWPSNHKLVTYSLIVLIFMVFMLLMSVVIGVLDMGASALVKLLVS